MELDHPNTSLDGKLGALADARRRTVLRFLRDQPDNVSSIDALVRHLDTREHGTGRGETATPEQLETELHHRHFPKLAEQGLVEYDVRSGRVRYCPDEATEALLKFVRTL